MYPTPGLLPYGSSTFNTPSTTQEQKLASLVDRVKSAVAESNWNVEAFRDAFNAHNQENVVYWDFLAYCKRQCEQAGPADLTALKIAPLIDEEMRHIRPFSQGHQPDWHSFSSSPFGPDGPRGLALRGRSGSNIWEPGPPLGGSQDRHFQAGLNSIAAFDAAEDTCQRRVDTMSKRQQPTMGCVIQDQSGRAIGASSVKGPALQEELEKSRHSFHQSILDQIPENERGNGHGYCAEQVVVPNAVHAQLQGEFQVSGSQITAFLTRSGQRVPACQTCQQTNSANCLHDTQQPILRPWRQ